MWLTNSSLGRKLIMAITGACLVLFVTFHCLMNTVAILWPAAYNQICLFLGANWYALVASAGLALLFIIHIIYALWLTVQNRKARGNDRYAVTSKPKQVEWASQNMLVLGIVVLAFLGLHLVQFWAKMQLAEVMGHHVPNPANGVYFIDLAFSCWLTPVCYVIGFIALWFHMTHGFWSMFQSCGWDNGTWMPRLKTIGNWWTSIVIVLFIAQAAVFTLRANRTCDCEVSQEWNAIVTGDACNACETVVVVEDVVVSANCECECCQSGCECECCQAECECCNAEGKCCKAQGECQNNCGACEKNENAND